MSIEREALQRLMKESMAILALCRDAVIESAGYTNLRCFERTIEDAGAVLEATQDAQKTGTPDPSAHVTVCCKRLSES